MFDDWLSGEYLAYYRLSQYKKRIDHVGQCLVHWNYGDAVVRNHLHEWLRFTSDVEERGIPFPSSFRAPEVQDYLTRRFPTGSASRHRTIRAPIRLLIETNAKGEVPRRIQAAPRPRNVLFQTIVVPYLSYLRQHTSVSEKTLCKRAFQLGVFSDFLVTKGLATWTDLSGALIHDFCRHLPGLQAATRLSYASTLRGFLRWAYTEGSLPQDLTAAAMTVRQYRHAGLPDVLTTSELDTLLGAVDRSHSVGRRDYAILLLAARYGMRPSDIRQLSLDDVDWRGARIRLCQSKTVNPLVLPLLSEVADALITYLRQGRPSTQARHIFVRHRAPFERFGPNNNLASIMRDALGRAGFQDRPGRRGLYLLRHTLATRLLGIGLPIKTISDVLGHTSTDTTFGYTKVDLPSLRSVALSLAEVLR